MTEKLSCLSKCSALMFNCMSFYVLFSRSGSSQGGSGGGSFPISPVRDTCQQYKHVQLKDIELVATLGMGGFGRVELVSTLIGAIWDLSSASQCHI